MSPAMPILDHHHHLHRPHHPPIKGVKHMYDNGIQHLPPSYILPPNERPRYKNANNKVSNPKLNLPVIDFSDLLGPNRYQTLRTLSRACEEYGFFQVVNHGIPEETVSEMVDVSRRFFEMPILEREKFMSDDLSMPVRYGTSFNQISDRVFSWRDFLKLMCSNDDDDVDGGASNWPSLPPDFRKLAGKYAKATKGLFQMLIEAVLESLGLELGNEENEGRKVLQELKNGSQLMVVNCYPPCPQPDLTLGMPPHSDYGFLTLLLQDEVEGLQIQHKDDWVTVQPIPGSFVVNIGDHLEIFSNGRYKSVMHRVIVNSINYRISVASLHSVAFKGTVVRPAAELITAANPRKYKDTDFASFLEYIKSCDSKKKNFLQSRKLN